MGTLKPEAKKKRRNDDTPEEPSRLLTQHTFDLMAEDDPDLQLRYSAGVEAQMTKPQPRLLNVVPDDLRALVATLDAQLADEDPS